MRSGYTKQDGTYVRAHGRGKHDDYNDTPESPLRIEEKKGMEDYKNQPHGLQPREKADEGQKFMPASKAIKMPKAPIDGNGRSDEGRTRSLYSSEGNPAEYRKAMELFNGGAEMTNGQKMRYDAMMKANPNRSRLYDKYKDNHFYKYIEPFLYGGDGGYAGYLSPKDSDFEGVENFSFKGPGERNNRFSELYHNMYNDSDISRDDVVKHWKDIQDIFGDSADDKPERWFEDGYVR